MVHSHQPIPQLPPPIEPAHNPFPITVAGAGVVEAETENISVGSAVPGVVVEVNVKVGQRVKAGDPLFRLDDRQLNSQLTIRRAMLEDARAQLEKLEAMPRKEELPAAEAKVQEAKADLENMEQQWTRGETLVKQNAMAEEEFTQRKQHALQARERYNTAVAEYELLKAGAWEPDKRLARAAIDQVAAQIKETETELDRLVVRALVDGEVLQVNVRPGEFVGAPANQALGGPGEHEAIERTGGHRRIRHSAIRGTRPGPGDAQGTLPTRFFSLRFVRIEPYVIPKKSLTGDNTERVDTRVLQVIYAIDAQGQRFFVGQQVDVFIDVGPQNTGTPVAEK